MLREKAAREGNEGGEGWKREWEETVDGLVERSEGWRYVVSSLYQLVMRKVDMDVLSTAG